MKKKVAGVVLAMAMAMFFMVGCMVGCTTFQKVEIQIDQESQEIISLIAARHAGDELTKEYPKIAEKVRVVCQDLINEESLDIIVTLTNSVALMLADEYIKDPLRTTIKDILSMIQVKTGMEITERWLAITKAVAEGLSEGIEMRQANE